MEVTSAKWTTFQGKQFSKEIPSQSTITTWKDFFPETESTMQDSNVRIFSYWASSNVLLRKAWNLGWWPPRVILSSKVIALFRSKHLEHQHHHQHHLLFFDISLNNVQAKCSKMWQSHVDDFDERTMQHWVATTKLAAELALALQQAILKSPIAIMRLHAHWFGLFVWQPPDNVGH